MQWERPTHGSASEASGAQNAGDNADKARIIQAPRGGYRSLPQEPGGDNQILCVVRSEAEYEHMEDSQEALAYRLNRGMKAIPLIIASSNTSNKPEEEFQSIKEEINNMEESNKEALQERSQSTRIKASQEAEILGTVTKRYGSIGTNG